MTGGGDVNNDIRDGLTLSAIVRKRTPVPSSCDDGDTTPNPVDTSLPTNDAATGPSNAPSTPAILCMVVQLIAGASWLYPDAKWTRNNKFGTAFQDVKLLCTGGVPQHLSSTPLLCQISTLPLTISAPSSVGLATGGTNGTHSSQTSRGHKCQALFVHGSH
jgi:hypothetical protein